MAADRTNARPGRRRSTQQESPPVEKRQSQYRHLCNPFQPLRVYSDDEVESIHTAALGLLENSGMRVLSEPVRARLAAAGADVDVATQTVRIDRGLVNSAIATVPRDISLTALDPQRNVRMGGSHVAFAPVAGPPNVTDLERGTPAGLDGRPVQLSEALPDIRRRSSARPLRRAAGRAPSVQAPGADPGSAHSE